MNACPTCHGWVNSLEALDTDEGRFHDRIECLTGQAYEDLVAKYACEEDHALERHVATLTPGRYDSDDLDRLAARWDR